MKAIRGILRIALFATSAMNCAAPAAAATFTYHGNLQDSGRAAEGRYDIELTLYSAATGGSAVAGPLVLYQVPVQSGSFSAQADFGPLSNIVGTAWLGVKVRPAGSGDFAALAARAPVSADATASVCPGAWTLAGNAGNPPGSYLGTADTQPLVLKTNAQPVATFAGASGFNGSSAVSGINVVFSDAHNTVAAATVGVTVSGGGSFAGIEYPQAVGAGGHFATISGGLGNSASGYATTVGGGASNTAIGSGATVCGGSHNQATGNVATIAGGIDGTASGETSGILSGEQNTASGYGSAVLGGFGNQAAGTYSMAAGTGSLASGYAATVAGGNDNLAYGAHSTVPGGNFNLAGGDDTFAAGNGARARAPSGSCTPGTCGDYGTFVWSDGSTSFFESSGPQQFLIQASGGVGINTTPVNDAIELTIAASPNGGNYANMFLRQGGGPSVIAGVMVSSGGATSTANNDAVFSIDRYNGTTQGHDLSIAGNGDFTIFSSNAYKPLGGSWAISSDGRLKRDVQPLDHPLDRMLQLRGVSFEYSNPDSTLHPAGRHTGFIAQEVQQVFPDWIGSTPDGYLTVGPNGFEALTVEALRDLRAEKDMEIATLQRNLEEAAERNATMQKRLDDLAAAVHRLEAQRER